MYQRSQRAACSLTLRIAVAAAVLLDGTGGVARQLDPSCGTRKAGSREEIFLHQRHAEARKRAVSGRTSTAAAANSDRTTTTVSGDVVLMDDQGGTVGRRNPFSLDSRTVTFEPTTPKAAKYTFHTSADSFDSASATGGTLLPLGDDDTRAVALPFSFPFFGKTYSQLYVNSDGNVTFGGGDSSSSDRGFGRFTSDLPRIAGLFDDLDPSVATSPSGVRVTVEPTRAVISWVGVPEYSSFGVAQGQTFQIRLNADGRVEIAFHGISALDAVVGISPGNLTSPATLVSINGGSADEFSGAVGERFSSSSGIDIVTVAQRFYESQSDAYDYLVIYNTLGIAPVLGAVAQETTVRNDRTGYGDALVADGPLYGSNRRLQSVLNMGYTAQYPLDPNATVPARGTAGDTSLSVIGHEAGHLFLAFVSVPDPFDAKAKPMLGRSNVHWSFFYNSEASLLEGNKITDFSPSSPQFATTGVTQQYSPLDQYLMGFRTPDEVLDSFYVFDPSIGGGNSRAPQFGLSFDGTKRLARVKDVIAVAGRRTPDSTVAQRHYRFAFVLVYAKGAPPTAEQIAQIDKYRSAFPDYYARVTGSRATAETTLRREVQFSGRPAVGVLQNQAAKAVLSLAAPAEKDVVFLLQTPSKVVSAQNDVTIFAGQSQVSFDLKGLKEGVEEFVAVPTDPRYETVRARVNVAPFAFFLKPVVVSGDQQTNSAPYALPKPVVLKVADINGVPYPGVAVVANASGGGSVEPAAGATSDENGEVRFTWVPAAGAGNQLTVSLAGVPGTDRTVSVKTTPEISEGGVVNAASFTPVLAPATFAAVFGSSLAAGITAVASYPFPLSLEGVQVLVNGQAVPIVSIYDRQINFVIPAETPVGPMDIGVVTPLGTSATTRVIANASAPAIFFGDGNLGAVRIAGTANTTADQPAAPGDYLEIYGTGLNGATPTVTIGGIEALVTYSGLFSLGVGFDQINVQLPDGVASGDQPLVVKAGGVTSNSVIVKVQ